jgi:hypothetical protein
MSFPSASMPGSSRGRALARELRLPVEHRHLVLLEQETDPRGQLLGDATGALDHLLQVKTDVVRTEAELVEVMQQVRDFGTAQQRLGRDAAPVEADAAQMLALDDHGLHAELRGADRGDIAAGAAADDHEIE